LRITAPRGKGREAFLRDPVTTNATVVLELASTFTWIRHERSGMPPRLTVAFGAKPPMDARNRQPVDGNGIARCLHSHQYIDGSKFRPACKRDMSFIPYLWRYVSIPSTLFFLLQGAQSPLVVIYSNGAGGNMRYSRAPVSPSSHLCRFVAFGLSMSLCPKSRLIHPPSPLPPSLPALLYQRPRPASG